MPSYIGGRHAVTHALKAGRRQVHDLYIQEGVRELSLKPLLDEAAKKGVSVSRVSKEFFAHHLDLETHQGVAAKLDELPFVELEDLIEALPATGKRRLLILDGIHDPQNLGALLRTAVSFGIQGVIWARRRAASLTPVAIKAASGAVEYLPLVRVTNLVQAINRLKEAEFWVYGSVAEDGSVLWDENFPPSAALVIGGEGEGLHRLIRENCDALVTIPCRGPIESLNASVAGGILMATFCR